MQQQIPMPQQQQPVSIEQYLSGQMYSKEIEKTFVDKILAKREIEDIKTLMEKETWDRKDISKLIYLIGAVEIKLLNFGEWERYTLGKYFAWLRDFISILEMLYDYKLKIENEEVETTPDGKEMLDNGYALLIHNTKASIDLFFYLGRSTLSLGNLAFDTISTSKYEYSYPMQPTEQAPENQKGILNFFRGGGQRR